MQPKPSVVPTAGLEPRQLATALLKSVLVRGRPLDESFETLTRSGRFAALEIRDRAFARAMSATALRRLGQTQALLTHFLSRPLPDDAEDIRLVLILALTQLVFMRAAPHAVLNTAVDEARSYRGGARFAGLVNAVLRRASREAAALVAAQDEARLNTPSWLFARWDAAYGEEAARRIAQAHLHEPPLDLTMKAQREEWAQALSGEPVGPFSVRLRHKGRVDELPGFRDGAWWVQDVAASLPVALLSDVRGARVADLCAAPGGKTAQLAAAGALVTAVDISSARLSRLAENLTRLGLRAELVAADAAAWNPSAPLDAVLLDAPCSSTGTIRRNPDIAYLKTPSDIETLSRLQAQLLAHAATLVKPGGVLVYCSCSLEPEEGERQAISALQANPDLAVDPIAGYEVGDARWITPHGYLRTLPYFLGGDIGEGGMDGFFAARFRKSG
jgi:16S rRNA (cytosine967-C5)-methyltransferase